MAIGGGGGGGGATGIRAGGAFVELFTKDGGLQKGLDRAKAGVAAAGRFFNATGASLKGYGAALSAPINKAFHQVLDRAGQIGKVSTRIGASASDVSLFASATGFGGERIDELSRHMERLAQRAYEARTKGGDAAEAFAAIGTSVKDLEGRKDDVFGLTLDSLEKISKLGKGDQLGALKALGGRGFEHDFAGLAASLDDGPNLKARMERAKYLGNEYTDEQVGQAKMISRAYGEIKNAAANAWEAVGKALLPYAKGIKAAAEQTVSLYVAIRRWVEEHQGLVAAAVVGGAALSFLGTAFLAVGSALAVAMVAWGGFVSAFGAVSAVASAVASVLTTGLLGPILLIPIALVAAGAAFLAFTERGRGMVSGLAETVMAMFDVTIANVLATWGSATAAFKRGDLEGAFAVTVGGLKLEWARLTVWLTDYWNQFKGIFLDGWRKTVGAFVDLWSVGVDRTAGLLVSLAEAVGIYSAEEAKGIREIMDADSAREQKERTNRRLDDAAKAGESRRLDTKAAEDELVAAERNQQFLLMRNAWREAMKITKKADRAKGPGDDMTKAAEVATRGAFGGDANALFFGVGVVPVAEKQLAELKGINANLKKIADRPADPLSFGGG